LAKDSTKQLFDKDYNWLGVFFNGLMKAKIRNGMIERLSFFDSLSRYTLLMYVLFLVRNQTLRGHSAFTQGWKIIVQFRGANAPSNLF